MLKVVDRGNGFVIQKITKPDGELVRYQTVPEERTPRDFDRIQCWDRLGDARRFIGKDQTPPQKVKKGRK